MIERGWHRVLAAYAAGALALAVCVSAGYGHGAGDGAGKTPMQRSASADRAPEVQGTIEATVNGTHVVWYSVAGESGGKPYSSSAWMDAGGGAHMVLLGGFVTEEPPVESFEWDASGMPASFGTYDGSTIGVVMQLGAGQSSATVTFPQTGGGGTMLSYQPKATLQDIPTTTFMVSDGTLSVTSADVSGGTARAEGSFSGTFRTMAGDRSVEITDGTFHVEGIPSIETIRR